jgi:hypothetical protein
MCHLLIWTGFEGTPSAEGCVCISQHIALPPNFLYI